MGPMLIPGVGIYMVGTAPVDIITEKAMRVRHSETTGQVLRRVKEQVLIHHTPPTHTSGSHYLNTLAYCQSIGYHTI